MAKKVFSGAAGAVALATDVARHVAWYLRYRVDGEARDEATTPGKD